MTKILHDGALREALYARVPGGAPVWAFLPQKDAFTPHETAWDVLRAAIEAYQLHKPTPQEGVSGQEPVAWTNAEHLKAFLDGRTSLLIAARNPEDFDGFDDTPLYLTTHPAPLPSHAALVEALKRARENFLAQCESDHPFVRDIDAALSASPLPGSGEGEPGLRNADGERIGWLDKFIADYRRDSMNPELHAHEEAAIRLFLDNLEKARAEARR